ncbi:MAG: IS66 family insertion sequence element accessory protein TnpB [Vulcanimicrobiota bacterium]
MLNLETVQQVYLAPGSTDMRKSIDGLAVLVSAVFRLNPFSESWFVFSNRERDKVKILRWDHNGFWLYYRRLERGRFRWPSSEEGQAMVISRRQLQWLLDGLNIDQPKAHRQVSAHIVI